MVNIKEKIVEILSLQLEIKKDEISDKSNLISDLGADSLDMIELIMAFEVEFGFEIPDEEADKLSTVKEIEEYIKKKKTT